MKINSFTSSIRELFELKSTGKIDKLITGYNNTYSNKGME